MKNILLTILLLPLLTLGQVINTFPWIHNFDNGIPLQQEINDDGDWLINQGPTGSFNTGPSGDHTTGNGLYFYTESSGNGVGFPNKQFIAYTPMFDVSSTPGRVLSFWYHMFGPTMGELEVAIIDTAGNYIFIDAYNGDQGMLWNFGYYPLDSFNIQHDFQVAFIGTTGSSYTSDICIDDIMVSDPFPVIFGCTDTISPNYDSTATLNDGSCIYIFGCMSDTATNYNPWANIDDGSCVMEVECNPGQVLLEVAILLDNWPSETYWDLTANGSLIYSVPSGTYDYTQTGQIAYTEVCVPVGDTIVFTINDTYGDGIGGGSVIGSCVVTNQSCGDTVFVLNPPNFGYSASSNPYVSDSCALDTIIPGCMDDDYVEFNPIATIDDGSCATLAIYGCTDVNAFNYDPNAHRMALASPCDYNLILYDAGGDSWGNCWLGVQQGNNLWQFRIDDNGVYSDTFNLSLSAYDEVYFYYFELPTIQQNAQQLDIQTIQNSFKLENAYGIIVHEGDNPWPGPNENKLRNYRTDDDIYIGQPYCDNLCIDVIYGCLDATAYNYNPLANTADTCYYNPGCTNPGYLEYYTQGYVADINDSSCQVLAVFGCTDPAAFNYSSAANVDNGGCVPVVLGCMNSLAFNYNPQANTPDTCIPVIYGCTSPIAFNYDSLANTDDGSCIGVIYGCTDSTMWNFMPSANVDDDSCIPYIYGCTDATMFNYCDSCNTDNGACIPFVYGCMDTSAFNYDPLANTDNGTCIPVILGCTNPIALNYCDSCNTDDFSCILPIYGCTDSTMFNYNPLANVDNNTCIPFTYGCTDPSMLNYNPQANTEDFSCIPYIYGCMDSTALNYDSLANTDNGSCVAVVEGCMDQSAYNYNSIANVNDSLSCLYDAGCITGPGAPYWLNDPCYAWVIEVDEYCCENEWDTICQATYNHCESGWTGEIPPSRVLNNEIIIYPNPTKDIVNIVGKDFSIKVYNISGELIIAEDNPTTIDLSNNASGMYTLHIQSNNNIIIKKIIKN
tara:strand:+ start:509 stop:3535 length:3027 start_codon:yes stop_codon:yes gene_type:complete